MSKDDTVSDPAYFGKMQRVLLSIVSTVTVNGSGDHPLSQEIRVTLDDALRRNWIGEKRYFSLWRFQYFESLSLPRRANAQNLVGSLGDLCSPPDREIS